MHLDTEGHEPIVRLTPKKAPFRRAGLHFKTLDARLLPASKLSATHVVMLLEEPLIDVDVSRDGGVTWRRFELPAEIASGLAPVTDPAHSPERAVDPTGPIVPRAPIDTPEGPALPPEAADPAVPVGESAPLDAGAPPTPPAPIDAGDPPPAPAPRGRHRH